MMGVSLVAYRARIGTFNNIKAIPSVSIDQSLMIPGLFSILRSVFPFLFKTGSLPVVVSMAMVLVVSYVLAVALGKYVLISLLNFFISRHTCRDFLVIISSFSLVVQMLLICSGSVETNPGPNSSVRNQISFCSWNIDSLLARDSSKINSIEGLQAVHNFDIFGICESYLTDKVKQQALQVNGFSPTPFRADCRDTASRPRGGVCLYYKEHLPIINRTDLANNIDETLVCEIRLRNKKILLFYLTDPKAIAQ